LNLHTKASTSLWNFLHHLSSPGPSPGFSRRGTQNRGHIIKYSIGWKQQQEGRAPLLLQTSIFRC